MIRSSVGMAVVLTCLLLAQPARAFVDSPYLTPATPMAGEDVRVNVRFGECDIFVSEAPYPVITQEGNAIRILFFGYSYNDPELCTYGSYVTSPSIGQFPADNYTLQVDWLYGGMGGYRTKKLTILPFTVETASISNEPVPDVGRIALALLIAVLVTSAFARLQQSVPYSKHIKDGISQNM